VLVKIGTGSGQVACVRPDKSLGSESITEGSYVQFRFGRGYGDKWERGKVWKIADDGRVFIDL
jgi:hypothetical protein